MARRRAGDYPERIVILTRTLAAADGVGEEVESWPDPSAGTGEHWARIDSAVAGETNQAPLVSGTTIQLRFRGEVPLESVDYVRIKDVETDCVVLAVWRERRKDGPGFQTVASVQG